MHKVLKVLKNQKTVASNKRNLVVGYNVDHLDHPIQLGSVNGSDFDDELKGKEAFDIPAPQFEEDPHPQNVDMAMDGAAGGSAVEDEDDEQEDESGSDKGEGDAGEERVVAVDDESKSRDD